MELTFYLDKQKIDIPIVKDQVVINATKKKHSTVRGYRGKVLYSSGRKVII